MVRGLMASLRPASLLEAPPNDLRQRHTISRSQSLKPGKGFRQDVKRAI